MLIGFLLREMLENNNSVLTSVCHKSVFEDILEEESMPKKGLRGVEVLCKEFC